MAIETWMFWTWTMKRICDCLPEVFLLVVTVCNIAETFCHIAFIPLLLADLSRFLILDDWFPIVSLRLKQVVALVPEFLGRIDRFHIIGA